MPFSAAKRLRELPASHPALLEKEWQKSGISGASPIDLRAAVPDRRTNDHIVHSLEIAVRDADSHRSQTEKGLWRFRESVASWHFQKQGLNLDPIKNVLPLCGSREGLTHLPLALLDPGDLALVPGLSWPYYRASILLAGGTCEEFPLLPERGYLPDLSAIPESSLKKAKLLYVNYPNNPTGAKATRAFFRELLDLAQKFGLAVASDAAYAGLVSHLEPSHSILEEPRALDLAVEFRSLSLTYNMSGWRVGWAAGNQDLIKSLSRLLGYYSGGGFQPAFEAGLAALEGDQSPVLEQALVYLARQDVFSKALSSCGAKAWAGGGPIFVWARVPRGHTSDSFCLKLAEEAGILALPGHLFGPSGEGYARFAMTQEMDRIKEAGERLSAMKP
jgi:LL-diaminopimelate aminotransferase